MGKGADGLKILARQLTMDFYHCKNSKLQEMEAIKSMLRDLLGGFGCRIIDVQGHEIEKQHYAIAALFGEGHVMLHVYTDLRYVAGDVFLFAENAQPEEFFKGIRKFFQPDKTKTTFLKRGEIAAASDIRPKVKTRVAPLRKIHNTGAKVIRILARRNRS